MNKIELSFSIGWFLLLAGGLVGCTIFDSNSTLQVYTYPPPKITQLSVSDTGVSMTLATDMNYLNHEDFSSFILLYGTSTKNFQSALDNASMGSLTTINQIPYYLVQTPKPTAAGNYLNSLTITLNLSNFSSLETYDFAAIAYGYNESYGRFYENNGWLYSKVSSPHTLHIPIFTNGTLTNGDALVTNSNGWQVSSDPNEMNDAVIFTFGFTINGEQHDVISARGEVGINPLGYASQTLSLPKNGYVDGGISNNYFVLESGYSYALKNLSANTYARLVINSIDSLEKRVTFKLVYTTVAGQRLF